MFHIDNYFKRETCEIQVQSPLL